jgi:hypothetical protein
MKLFLRVVSAGTDGISHNRLMNSMPNNYNYSYHNRGNDNDDKEKEQVLTLTRKKFYTRMALLKASGLVQRHRDMYMLTSLGKIIFYVLRTIEKATDLQSALSVIDIINRHDDIAQQVKDRLLFDSIPDTTIRTILLLREGEGEEQEQGAEGDNKQEKEREGREGREGR